ncbi:MAG: Gfo/Idh/MocA family oxidoreductase [Planctomycetes bacterium]|nr:Gfo/Idh/MocA family oxidoreductase [Planctomycetota bacterium]
MTSEPAKNVSSLSRREVLRTGGVVIASGAIASALPAGTLGFHRSGTDVLRVGLVGCGGRGTGAAAQALSADPQVELVAMGDAFADHVETALKSLRANPEFAARVKVDDDHKFTGFDNYKRVIDAVDVVLFATSPHFRPMQVEYAAQSGKHMFVEKPIATDSPGVRRVMAACEVARQKKLNVVSGLCYRYEKKKRETIRRVHDGAIGKIIAAQTTYNTGGLWHRGRQSEWSDMEWQMRNWLYFTWLSGDHIVEQHIHSLDKVAWALGDKYPVRVTASGGRAQRTEEKWGNIYDHFNTVYEYEDGVKVFSSCRQWNGASSDVSDHLFGTKGIAHLQSHTIEGDKAWRYREVEGEQDDMYQNEHNELFAAIRKGKVIDNSDYMCKSTMMAIMARMAAYTGQTLTWEQAWNSQEDLSPASYEWTSIATPPVAIPGVSKFI